RYPLERLLRASRGDDQEICPNIAVALLARREGAGVEDQLGAVLRSDGADRRARLTAAQELARRGTPAAAGELRFALDATTGEYPRAAADGLAALAVTRGSADRRWPAVAAEAVAARTPAEVLPRPAKRHATEVARRAAKKAEVTGAVAH